MLSFSPPQRGLSPGRRRGAPPRSRPSPVESGRWPGPVWWSPAPSPPWLLPSGGAGAGWRSGWSSQEDAVSLRGAPPSTARTPVTWPGSTSDGPPSTGGSQRGTVRWDWSRSACRTHGPLRSPWRARRRGTGGPRGPSPWRSLVGWRENYIYFITRGQ